MNRITTSDGYYDESDCPLGDCERRYCPDHRLLFRDHDTMYLDCIGDGDVPGGLHSFWNSEGECPMCVQDSKMRRFKELQTLGGTR